MPHVTFVHGIANKPPADRLLDLWRRSLAEGAEGADGGATGGIDLGAAGITSSMVYWADVMYDQPLAEEDTESAMDEAVGEARAAGVEPAADLGIGQMDAGERLWVASLAAKLAVPLAVAEVAGAATSASAAAGAEPAADKHPPAGAGIAAGGPVQDVLERIPLPWAVKERIMRKFLRDVHHYLFNVEYSPRAGATFRVQDEIRGRMLKALDEGAAKDPPHVVVSHSMGTVIAYDCLRRVGAVPAVDSLMTVGSPLGLDEIQDKLRPEWSRDDGFPRPKLRGGWVNVFDHLDPVAGFDPRLANDYRLGGREVVDDLNEQNHGTWRHDISKYLAGAGLRGKLRQMLGL